MNNPFWHYSVRQYAQPGVAQACLKLQDEHGLDVNMLLYAAWLASEGRQPDRGHLTALARKVEDWRRRVVQPLRELRVQWKGFAPAEMLREQLQSLELEAERVQQDMMLAFYEASTPPSSEATDVAMNLVIVAESTAGGGRDWKSETRRLAALLDD